jgi:endonuclease YncB( thermonuclease family)
VAIRRYILPIFLLFLFTSPSHASEFIGRVVSVKDGDTIEVLHNRKAERIRLSGIDCPEKKQAFGHRAKQATSALSFGQNVTVKSDGNDRYGRTLANVVLPNGGNLNHELVKGGWC